MTVGAVVGKLEREMLDQHQAFPINWLSAWVALYGPIINLYAPYKKYNIGVFIIQKTSAARQYRAEKQ